MNKAINAFFATFFLITVVGLLLGCLSGFLLMIGFGIWHLHVDSSIPAVGWWTAWPLGLIFSLITSKGANAAKKSK